MYFRIQFGPDSLLALKIGRTPVKLFESIEPDVVASAVLSGVIQKELRWDSARYSNSAEDSARYNNSAGDSGRYSIDKSAWTWLMSANENRNYSGSRRT